MRIKPTIRKKRSCNRKSRLLTCLLLPTLYCLLLSPPKAVVRSQQVRVGLAPHDRPACQLVPIATQRRQLAGNQANGLENVFGDSFEQQPGTGNQSLAATSIISAPNVVSIQQQQPSASQRKFDSSERLRQLRQLLVSNNYDAYLVTPNDEHGSEYVTEYDRRLRFISGFTGSNGLALVLLDRAVLFTDGRYAIQADQDLDCNWWLVVSDEPLVDIPLWLKANAAKGIKIATDARLMSLQSFDYLDEQIKKLDSEFALISQDLVDVVWDNNSNGASGGGSGDTSSNLDHGRPISHAPIVVHPIQFNGNISWQEKVVRLSDSMQKLRARHYIVSQLDDIAWLLNLRGNDIPMSPLFKAYLLVSRSPVAVDPISVAGSAAKPATVSGSVEQLLLTGSATGSTTNQLNLKSPQVLQVQANQVIRLTLYTDLKKIGQQVREHLHVDTNGTFVVQPNTVRVGSAEALDGGLQVAAPSSSRIQVELRDYNVFIMDIRDKLAPANNGRPQLQGKLLLDAKANVAIHVLAKAYEDRLILVESLINKLKSVKSEAEVQGMRLAHWRDSLAIAMLLAQLELDIGQKGLTNKWSETSAASELEFYRSLMDYNKGQSFDTISAYGSNAAIVHYKPPSSADLEQQLASAKRVFIGNQSTYLLDSGGQYLDGTTDITRTSHYGEPSEFQRETYTRVLMGAVDMMSLIFDQSHRSAYRLNDLLARRHLFELGLDYLHGTGHGIGLYSLVHEAPALIEHYSSNANQRAKGMKSALSDNGQPQVLSEPLPLQANMFTSVEPGYYKANDFGIRLENIVVSQRVHLPAALARPNDRQQQQQPSAGSQPSSAERQFLRFEPISLVPFEPKLMKLELLSNKQKAWLNSYNLMVRLRMTQQINYYLSKLRNLHSQPIQVLGTSSSSHIYQHLLSIPQSSHKANTSRTAAGADLGYYNFLRIEAGQFQEKLEQTHRWIMAKTELIPLDLPQSAASSVSSARQLLQASNRQHLAAGRSGDQSSGADLSGQRLMLAYMSSLPFNDAEAGEAAASLASADKLEVRQDTAGNASSSASSTGSRCSGLQCDLWLLGALNAQGRQQRQRLATDWPAEVAADLEGLSSLPSSSSLMDMFRLVGSSEGSSLAGMWSLIALASLVVLQMAVLVYMCAAGFRTPQAFSVSANERATV